MRQETDTRRVERKRMDRETERERWRERWIERDGGASSRQMDSVRTHTHTHTHRKLFQLVKSYGAAVQEHRC